MQSQSSILIAASAWRVERRLSGYWQVSITWRFTNLQGSPLFLLLAVPRAVGADGHVVLDHCAPDDLNDLYFNQPPGFRIATLAPHQSLDEQESANIPADDAASQVTAVGRFGYSETAPDSDWERTHNWLQVRQWQKKADSAEFSIQRGQ